MKPAEIPEQAWQEAVEAARDAEDRYWNEVEYSAANDEDAMLAALSAVAPILLAAYRDALAAQAEQTRCTTFDCRNRATRLVSCEDEGAFPYCAACAAALLRAGESDRGPVAPEDLTADRDRYKAQVERLDRMIEHERSARADVGDQRQQAVEAMEAEARRADGWKAMAARLHDTARSNPWPVAPALIDALAAFRALQDEEEVHD